MGLFLISPVFLHNGTTDDVESRDQIEQYSSRIHTFVQGLSSSSFIDHGSKQSRQNRVGLDLYFLQKRMYVQNGDTHFPKRQKVHKNYLNLVANIMHYLCFRNRRCWCRKWPHSIFVDKSILKTNLEIKIGLNVPTTFGLEAFSKDISCPKLVGTPCMLVELKWSQNE